MYCISYPYMCVLAMYSFILVILLTTHCQMYPFDSVFKGCTNFLFSFKATLFTLISCSFVDWNASLSYGATLWLSSFPYPFPPSQDQASKDKALQNMASLSSAQIVSPSIIKNHLPPLPPAPYQPARVSPPFCPCNSILRRF